MIKKTMTNIFIVISSIFSVLLTLGVLYVISENLY